MSLGVRGLAVAATAGAAFVLTSVAAAGAVPYVPRGRNARTGQVATLAYGPACLGEVTGFAFVRKADPGAVDFGVSGGFVGISGNGGPCVVRATIHWANVTTGKRAAVSGFARGNLPGLGENQSGFSKRVNTGRGTVRFSVTTDRPYLAQPSVTIQTY
ncbi:MAG: hypothetical protein QM728_10590 [Gordonia sp. (in: high G+C Gram-positive bacteria)]|uniref:hypothetical protein n=1 Tax=Gordonia sp. (in: high G+C Gram-positive bacteria) TaxID=84139 RepID=UPI0039E3B8F7